MATAFQFQPGSDEPEAVYPAAEPVSPLDLTAQGTVPPVDLAPRVRPQPEQPPAELRAYEPTWRERMAAGAQSTLEGAGMDRYRARRTAQTVLGGPSTNLPLGAGLIDIPLLPATPLFMQEGYRSTERAAGAAQRGDYGTAAMEYLGAVGQMLPGAMVAQKVVPPVARALGESMAQGAITSPMARSQRGVFGGVSAKTADLRALGRAESLELEGKAPEEVWQDTGWFRGADGKWRFEIDDSKAAFKGIEGFAKYRDKQYAELTTLNDALEARKLIDDGVSQEELQLVFSQTTGKDLSDDALKLAGRFKQPTLESKARNASQVLSNVVKNVPLKDVLTHPELFAAYPELADLPVNFLPEQSLGEGVVGSYRAGRPGAIDVLQQYGLVPEGAAQGRQTMLHEGMHAIQQREGFSPGTSEEDVAAAIAAGRLPPDITPQQGYMGAAGEVEGRLTEARADLTPEERQMFPPMSQESGFFGPEVPYGEQFVGTAGQPFPARALSTGPGGSQRGAVLFGMGGEPAARRAATVRFADDSGIVSNESVLGGLRRISEDDDIALDSPKRAGAIMLTGIDRQAGGERGRASEVLRTLTAWADKNNERLVLMPSASGDLKQSDLIAWYERNGFVQMADGAMERNPAPTLRDVLAEQPTTLRTLENLPGRRTTLTVSEIREQLRRPEVTKAEKDVLERVLARTEGDSISAENLVREVGLETKNFRLTPNDTDEFADYGLAGIGRDSTPAEWTGGTSQPNAQNARTTVHRTPTPTATNNHFRDPNYFGHTRAFEDMQGIPHVVEIQSDLVQKAGKELLPEERTRLEQAFDSVITQETVVNPLLSAFPSGEGNVIAWTSSAAGDILQNQQKLLQANPDFLMLLEEDIISRLSVDTINDITSRTGLDNEGDLLQYIATNLSGTFAVPRMQHIDISLALEQSLKDISSKLSVLGSEHGAKLEQGAAATAQRPMFKNWERRLIREELRRAATPQPTPEYERLRARAKADMKELKRVEEFAREEGYSDVGDDPTVRYLRQEAEDSARRVLEVERYKPIPPVVRFADADTIALVEGWAPKLSITPGEAMDSTLAGNRLIGSRVGTPNDWRYTGNVRIDENGVWEAERVPIDTTGRQIGNPRWSHSGTASISEDIIQQFVKREPGKFEHKEHQGIYDRYNKEVSNYLKSLGGKQVKDAKGHGWWEVPVKPEQRRTQIFSMGGAAVAGGGAAAYNAQDAEATGAQ